MSLYKQVLSCSTIVDIISVVSHLQVTLVLLGHRGYLLLELGLLFEVFLDLLITLAHIFGDQGGQLHQRSFGAVFKSVPLELFNVLFVGH